MINDSNTKHQYSTFLRNCCANVCGSKKQPDQLARGGISFEKLLPKYYCHKIFSSSRPFGDTFGLIIPKLCISASMRKKMYLFKTLCSFGIIWYTDIFCGFQ